MPLVKVFIKTNKQKKNQDHIYSRNSDKDEHTYIWTRSKSPFIIPRLAPTIIINTTSADMSQSNNHLPFRFIIPSLHMYKPH